MLKTIAAMLMVVTLCQRSPAATWIVDQSSSAAGESGSADRPFKTICAASQVAQPGDRVIVHPGVYRENVKMKRSGEANAPIRFEAQPPGSAIITGADVIAGWRHVDGDAPIYRVAWNYVFAIDHDASGKPIEHHPADQPLWGRAEQVIADGKVMLPCRDLNDLRSAWRDREKRLLSPTKKIGGPFGGMFAADTTSHQLYLWLGDGGDPNRSHTIEASTRRQLFGVSEFESATGVHDVQVSGFVFKYAANFPQRAGVVLHGKDNLIEHCLIESMNGMGVEVDGTLRDCVIRNNGHIGGSAEGDGFLNRHCVWQGNCWKPITRGWESGGAKVCDSRGGKFIDCTFDRNGGPGLWFDIDCRDIDVQNCNFIENEMSGLFIEISQNIRAHNNVMIANATNAIGQLPEDGWSCGGVQIGESHHCEIRDNLLIGNYDGIALREIGPRTVKTRGQTNTYHTAAITIGGNTIADSQKYQISLWWDNAFFGPHPSSKVKYTSHDDWIRYLATSGQNVIDPLRQDLRIDGDMFAGGGGFGGGGFLYGVPWRAESRKLETLTDFAKLTGFEKTAKVGAVPDSPMRQIRDETQKFSPFSKG